MEDIPKDVNTDEAGIIRDSLGRFVPGVSGNPEGMPPMTSEQKAVRRATKELISDYKEKLAEALPQISPIIIAKAVGGDIQAIKEIHDRVMGKAPQPVELGNPEGLPFLIRVIQDNATTTRTDSQTIQNPV